ncbi:MAG: SHOCT domain-containing protein [Ferruginibacter sp.]|nr:SHOCT domain-containing protein [Ferruginibacter sp.]
MKKLLWAFLLSPFISAAQNNLPSFLNDTLTTTGGYKIYKGQTLQFGTGTSAAGYFNFIKFHQGMAKNNTYTLQSGTMLVKNLKAYKYSGPDNNSIRIAGTVTYKDGKKEEADILVNFERATEDYDGQPSELNIAEQFKRKPGQATVKQETKKQPAAAEPQKQSTPEDLKKILVADEIKKLFDLYKAGALTKEEYEAQKKKLLERQ